MQYEHFPVSSVMKLMNTLLYTSTYICLNECVYYVYVPYFIICML